MVERELLTLKDVSIDTSGLARAGRDTGEDTSSGELGLEGGIDLGVDLAGGDLALDGLGLGDSLGGGKGLNGLGSATLSEGGSVVSLVPLTEGSGIDLDDGGPGQGVGAWIDVRETRMMRVIWKYVRTSSLLEGW